MGGKFQLFSRSVNKLYCIAILHYGDAEGRRVGTSLSTGKAFLISWSNRRQLGVGYSVPPRKVGKLERLLAVPGGLPTFL
jgi:hypothetical protein